VARVSLELVFETHSTSEDNEAGIATGSLPGKLSATGRLQARALGERRRDDGITVVFASDLRRAVETAEIAFEDSALPVVTDERLRECDCGELNGTAEPVRRGKGAHLDVPYPGGESWRQAVERTARFLEELRTERDGERVLVIGHSATRLACEVANGRQLEDVIAEPFAWQPGWEYVF